MANGNLNANPAVGPYKTSLYSPTSSISYHGLANVGALYNRTVRVTATTNSPLTLTGSYANNAGFLIINTGSVWLTTSDGTQYVGSDFHEPSQNHQIFPIGLSYVSASAGGDVTVLYYK
jgi:hypothetical protein